MIKIGKISSVEGNKYRVWIDELGDFVTLPFARLGNKLQFDLSPGEQNLTVINKKFEVGENVLVAFTGENFEEGVIIGNIDA